LQELALSSNVAEGTRTAHSVLYLSAYYKFQNIGGHE